ncbi:phosphodiester glycosidase family protein [Ectobacillus ponti]|uniref:Phosphodiester glycosidase family protein n=1 Tax=Ectobacillus ponti TaxID=2961894 RepID=A0AA41XCH8_9BACI|nr:phosphodiester glycosidase family protein [Ectobacillus ponti]MCP8970395.1 phosphodiester glycosidase family protein [Ectobacillus ponti]
MRRWVKRITKIFVILFLLGSALASAILFGTSYGHQLRVIAAESILTSQHRQWAKYTLLSEKELKDILENITNPKWVDSGKAVNLTLSQRELKRREPLAITITTISRTYSDHYFEGKLMTVSNPLNVKLVMQQGAQGAESGEQIDVMAKRNHALAAVNASGFDDETGHGSGKTPIGTVIANGQVMNAEEGRDTPSLISGLTADGDMITGNYSPNQLLQQGVVSAAGFIPQLIVKGEKMITKGNGGWGYGPRTIMAQKKDGTMIFLVIDGRQKHSIGASLKDCQDILYDMGAYNAMAMDGGSSASIYAMDQLLNIPSTLSHQARHLPNCWVVTARSGQKVEITIDGQPASSREISNIIGS